MLKLSKELGVLYLSAFFIKGWEVSLILLLPFIQQTSSLTLFDVGLLTGCMSFFQIICALFAGHISQKIGSKKVMMIAIFSYFVSWIIISFDTSFAVLLPVYALAGLASGIFMPVANAAVARLSTSRAISLGNFSAAADLGRVASSAITTVLIGFQSLLIISSTFGFTAIVALVGYLRIKSDKEVKPVVHEIVTVKMRTIIKNKKFLYCVLTGMFDSFSSASLFIFIPFLLLQKGINIQAISFLTGLFFLGYFSGRILLGRLSDKHGESKVLIYGEILMAVLIVALIFINNFILILIILFLLGVFTRGTSPIIRAMVARAVDDHDGLSTGSSHISYDKAYSFYSFSVNSSTVVSRGLYGFMAGLIGLNSVFYLSGTIALLTIIPILLFRTIQPHNRKSFDKV